jgi:hypothetical protein
MILLDRWIIAVILSVGLVSTVGSAPGQSSSAKRQAPPVEAAKPDLATADQMQPDQAAKPDQPAADQAGADQAAPDQTTPDQASDQDQAKPDQPAADQATSDQAKPEEPAADQATADQAKPEEPAADQAAADPAKPEEPVADKTTSDQPKPDQPEANQPAAKQVVATPHGTPEEQQLQKETTRLLQLVQELKAEVAKAGSNTLSLTAVRKADEVLKLSKDLKERMKERGPVPQSRTQ